MRNIWDPIPDSIETSRNGFEHNTKPMAAKEIVVSCWVTFEDGAHPPQKKNGTAKYPPEYASRNARAARHTRFLWVPRTQH